MYMTMGLHGFTWVCMGSFEYMGSFIYRTMGLFLPWVRSIYGTMGLLIPWVHWGFLFTWVHSPFDWERCNFFMFLGVCIVPSIFKSTRCEIRDLILGIGSVFSPYTVVYLGFYDL